MTTTSVFDDVIDFLTSCPQPKEVIAFKPSPSSQRRVSELLEKKRDGHLTESERHELEHFLIIEHLMRLAKARARKRLAS